MGGKVRDVISTGFSQCGYHNIENELVFHSNPGFIFHDSCGFESGSIAEFEDMKTFVAGCSIATKL
ncbi:hypothetical protein ID866_13039, partial [Astraeus odoratus]